MIAALAVTLLAAVVFGAALGWGLREFVAKRQQPVHPENVEDARAHLEALWHKP